MFLAAAAALSLSLGSAYAGEIQRDAGLRDDNLTPGIQENTYFQQLPGVFAQAPVQTPTVATEQNRQAVHEPGRS